MTRIKNSQLVSAPLPKKAILTKRTNVMKRVERRWIAKKGFWAIVTTIGRERTIVPLTLKDGTIDRREPKSPFVSERCDDCGCDFKNFSHERCQ